MADGLRLTRGDVAVLQAILATGLVLDDPFEPIFPRKATLARIADVGEATVYRALSRLESIGLIQRTDQTRLQDGTLDLTTIVITERLAEMLQLTGRPLITADSNSEDSDRNSALVDTDKSTQPITSPNNRATSAHHPAYSQIPTTEVKNGTHTSNSQHGTKAALQLCNQGVSMASHKTPVLTAHLIDGLRDGPIYKEQTVEPKASVNYQSAPSKYVRIEGRSVAQELLWLITENRLTFGGLFKLQRLAKRVPGQRLSDYVALKSERIRQLPTTNDCYKFILSLISQELDAKHLLKLRSEREHRECRSAQRQQAAAARTRWLRAHHERTFVDPKSRVTYRINANHSLLELGHDGRPTQQPSLRVTGRFIQDVQAGRLVPFVPSTPTASHERRTQALQLMKDIIFKGQTLA